MDNSPLLLLCPDISEIIGNYLATYKNNLKMKKELRYKIDRSMVKCFNIQCKEFKRRDRPWHLCNNSSLYKIPDIRKWRYDRDGTWQWVWKGKRMGEPTDNFIIRRISKRAGVTAGMKLLIFPKRLQDLNDLGYFRTKLLLNELK
jgi:hypothetical protein